MNLSDWVSKLKSQFDERELAYMSVQKARINIVLKDSETGELHLHEVEYESKEEANSMKRLIISKEKLESDSELIELFKRFGWEVEVRN